MASKKQEIIHADLAPDPFLDKANAYAGAVEKNLKVIIGVAGIAVVGAIAAILISQSGERKASARTAELTAAVDAYNDAVDPQKTLTATIASLQEASARAVMPKFEALITEHDAIADISKLYLADLSRRAGDTAKAEAQYREYIKATGASDPMRMTAQEGLGYALEAQNKLDEALAAFVELGDVQGKAFADLALKHQARIKEQKGDKPGAIELYRALLDRFPESKLREAAEQRIAALQ